MALSAADQKRLREIVALGHELERLWPLPTASSPLPSDEALALLGKLRAAIRSCASGAESHDLGRLAFHERDLTEGMTARHLAAILVPFERLLSRALRDDEFLVHEEDALAHERDVAPLVVVAENIRSAFNVGAILRTSECFGVEEVVLSGYTPTPEEEKTARTSMGTQDQVPWRSAPRAVDALKELKTRGYEVVALETVESAETLGEFAWPEKAALVLGNERFGVDRETLAEADRIVRIPLHGRKNSLNVGIALGIALADWRRTRSTDISSSKSLSPPSDHALEPIGVFRSEKVYPYEARRQGVADETREVGWVELERGRGYEQALEDLAGFDRIWLLYRFHHNENWKPKVMPPRGPRVKRGVFATRAPYRPNPLGLSAVELERVEGLKVYVKGFDLLDGTPIYDIKPYLPYADSFPEAKIGWLEGVAEDAYGVAFAPEAEAQLSWLEDHGVDQIRGFLIGQLEHDPLDSDRKRVTTVKSASEAATSSSETTHRIAYRTWRADFQIEVGTRRIEISRLRSGYTEEDLASSEDKYRDKDIHRAFNREFGGK